MPEEADEEFDDVVVVDKPICNQIEEFAKAQVNTPPQNGRLDRLKQTS